MTGPRQRSEDAHKSEIAGFAPNKTRAGIGGISGGTGLVAIAQAIGPDKPLGAVLLYLTPVVSFVVGALLFYAETQLVRNIERRLVKSARRTLEKALDSTRTSDDHKTKIRRMLEDLEEAVATAEVQRVKQASLLKPSQTPASN